MILCGLLFQARMFSPRQLIMIKYLYGCSEFFDNENNDDVLYTRLQSVGLVSSIRKFNARGLSTQCIGSARVSVLYRRSYA